MRVLGIDPGLGGAFALFDSGLNILIVRDMPTLPGTKGKQLVSPSGCAEIIEAFEPDIALVERVASMSKQGVASSFNFGVSYGVIQGALGAKGVPYHLITPREWKKHFRLRADKGAARTIASRIFPQQTELFSRSKDHGRAEAALIAHFGLTNIRTYLPTAKHTRKRIDNAI